MIIAVDIDNVLNNLTEKVIELYNADAADCLKLSDIQCYSIESYMNPAYYHKLDYYFSCAAVLAKTQPGAVECVKRLQNDGHTIFFVTSTTCDALAKKFDWLRRNFGNISENQVVKLNNKQLFECDVMIDDYIGNLTGGKYKKIVLNQPWNTMKQEFDKLLGLHRAQKWDDIYRLIKEGVVQ